MRTKRDKSRDEICEELRECLDYAKELEKMQLDHHKLAGNATDLAMRNEEMDKKAECRKLMIEALRLAAGAEMLLMPIRPELLDDHMNNGSTATGLPRSYYWDEVLAEVKDSKAFDKARASAGK